MTIVSALSPISLAQFFYQSGKLVRPARLYFYKPNTEDSYTVYTEPTLGIPYDQPVLTGGSGRVPPIYIGQDPYRIRVYDSYGSLVEDIDYLPGAVDVGDGGGGGGDPTAPGAVLQTGDMFFAMSGAGNPRTGCVRANGGLICPVGFDSTAYPGQVERRNDDAHALFVLLWGQDGANVLEVVPGGKGAAAEDDWVANKAIRLPDLRGRAIVGTAHMNIPSDRLNGITITGHPYWSGSSGGSATSTMTAAQMPSHAHVVGGSLSGVTVGSSSTGVTVNSSSTGLSLNANFSGCTVNATFIGISVGGSTTGASISQTTHTHTYDTAPPDRRAVRLPAGVGDDGPVVMLPVEGPEPFVINNTSAANANVTFNDATHGHAVSELAHGHSVSETAHTHTVSETAHTHTIIEPAGGHTHTIIEPAGGHTHTMQATGGGGAMQTISPFALAAVYIKL